MTTPAETCPMPEDLSPARFRATRQSAFMFIERQRFFANFRDFAVDTACPDANILDMRNRPLLTTLCCLPVFGASVVVAPMVVAPMVVATVAGTLMAGDASGARPPSRDDVSAEVARARSATPAFRLSARVRTTGEGSEHVRLEEVRCEPAVAIAITRSVNAADAQCIATDGIVDLRYFLSDAGDGDAAGAQGGGIRRPANARTLSLVRSAADTFMAWPLAADVCARVENEPLTHGLEAWLQQPQVQVDSEWHLIGGVPCVRATRPALASHEQTIHYYLDPSANWLPRRYEAFSGDTLILEREVLEFGWFGSGLCLPVRAIERAPAMGRSVEMNLVAEADGTLAAGPLPEAVDLMTPPPAVEVSAGG